MSTNSINTKLVWVLLFLVLLCVLYINNQSLIQQNVRDFLEWKHLTASIWLAVLCCFVINYIANVETASSGTGLIYKHFGRFGDAGFSFITYGLGATTSSSILKGVYIQQMYGDMVYFKHFGDIDIYSMLIVCFFLFWYSIFWSGKALIDGLITTGAESAEPVVNGGE